MNTLLRRATAFLAGSALVVLALGSAPSQAVNADHGTQVVSELPVLGTPHVMNGTVTAITQVGDKIIAAGTFTSVSPSATFTDTSDDITRNRIFAFDATTGVIDPTFNPSLGGAANSLDTDGTYIYVGGAFGSVRGSTAIRRVVKLNASGAVVAAFKAVPNDAVNEVVVRGARLYVGGRFTQVTRGSVTTTRRALAALDSTTGAVLAGVNVPFTGVYDPKDRTPGKTNIKRFDVTPDGSRLVAVGNFGAVGGQTRAQVAAVDTSGARATVAPWATNRFNRARNDCGRKFDSFVRDIDLSPDGSHFVITTSGGFAGGAATNTMCDTTSRWETTSNANNPTWVNYTGGDTSEGVAITGAAIYVGGHQRWQNNPSSRGRAGPGAVPREGIAALDPVNGLPLSWNPGRTRGVGAQALFATSQGLWVGSDTTLMAHQRRGRIALMPLAGGTTIDEVATAALPGTLFGARESDSVLERRPVDDQGAPRGPATTANTEMAWSNVRGAFLLNGTLYYGLNDNGLYQRTFAPKTGALGAPRAVNLYDDPETGQRIPFALSTLTGMFYDPATHRIYYTVSADSRLYYRYFTPESNVVGAQTFQADAGGVNFATVAGMTLASGKILFGSSSDGALRSASFSAGRVTSAATVVSSDGTWRYRALFIPNK